jgi:hypothetical protein
VWRSHAQLELATVDYVACFNTRRLHSSLGNIPPVEHGQRHVAAAAAHPEALLLPTGSVTLNHPGVYDPFGVASDLRNQAIALTRSNYSQDLQTGLRRTQGIPCWRVAATKGGPGVDGQVLEESEANFRANLFSTRSESNELGVLLSSAGESG